MISYSRKIYDILTVGYSGREILNVHPLSAPKDTPLPIITFKRVGTNRYTKDMRIGSDITLEIVVLAKTYFDSVEISEYVTNALLNNNILLNDVDEYYVDGVYGQILTFSELIA